MQPSLKIIHLSSSIEGGAGIAARRLNQGLIKRDIDSTLLTLSKASLPGELTIRRSLRSLIIGKLNSYFAGKISNQTFLSVMSVNSLNIKKFRKIVKPEEGIIHIHNWFNLVSIKTIQELANSGYRIVFTLHDQRMFTGGCHYSLGCEQFKTSCSTCPELHSALWKLPSRAQLQGIKLATNNSKTLVYIAPSKWIEMQARASSILKDSKIVSITNTLDNFYNKHSFHVSNQLDGLNLNKIRIGIASKDPFSYIKGGDLVAAINLQPEFHEYFQFIFMADFQVGAKENFWDSIDLLFVPSRFDNSPNVIHEAKSIGIPVIASRVGGIPELLDENHDILVSVADIGVDFFSARLEEVSRIVRNSHSRLDQIDAFRSLSEVSISDHIELYRDLMQS
jgi:glycosyltransferase involved in cell wall biosynthesis